jgi:phosphoadenosine phosphosulfate reductase
MLWVKEIDRAMSVINEVISLYSHPYVSMSWGKDSIFLFHLIRQINPDIPVIYVNSNYALPDTYDIRDRLLDLWNPNYYEINQPLDYIDLCKIAGLPSERTTQGQKKVVELLKKNVLDEFAVNHGFDLCFWGIRCDESKGRSHLYRKHGFLVNSVEPAKCHPIALIKTEQLWYFYEKFKIPINGIYLKNMFLDKFQIRNTGWLSNDGSERGKMQWLKFYHPNIYNKLSKEFPIIRKY